MKYKYTYLTDEPGIYLEQEVVTEMALAELYNTQRNNTILLTIEAVIRNDCINAIPMWRSSVKDYNKS